MQLKLMENIVFRHLSYKIPTLIEVTLLTEVSAELYDWKLKITDNLKKLKVIIQWMPLQTW